MWCGAARGALDAADVPGRSAAAIDFERCSVVVRKFVRPRGKQRPAKLRETIRRSRRMEAPRSLVVRRRKRRVQQSEQSAVDAVPGRFAAGRDERAQRYCRSRSAERDDRDGFRQSERVAHRAYGSLEKRKRFGLASE